MSDASETLATWRTRFGSRLVEERGPDPQLDTLVGPGRWFGGGEPTLRPDLPALLSRSPGAGLITDGLAFQDPAGLRRLDGLSALRIQLHSARPDAHDWLLGRRGATRGAIRAVRAALAAGLEVQLAATLTRPTSPHLAETVEVAERLGVRHLVVSWPRWVAPDDRVALTPQLGVSRPHLERAQAVASRAGVHLDLSGLPDEPAADTPEPVLRFVDQPSRGLRVALVRLAEHHRALRVEGHADHPAAPDLLRDCTRLFDTVDVVLRGSIDGWSERDRRQLRRLTRLEVLP